jgi:YesN/AraC family two-component response regulator
LERKKVVLIQNHESGEEQMEEKNEKTVLIADDEESIREIVKIHLENEGYTVITSQNGEEAIHALKENDISLAITDLKMPKVDGFGVLDYINEHHHFVPAIVLTGYMDVELAVKAMKKGCSDYIIKPIRKTEFMDVVEKALNKKDSKQDQEPFEILGVYLLDEGGLVIYYKDLTQHPKYNSDMFGSMFSAIKTFIKDSLHSDEDLRFIEHGSLKILVKEGKKFFLVVIGKGGNVEPVKEEMERIVMTLSQRYGETISHWMGNTDLVFGIESEFEDIFRIFRKG